MRDCEVKGAWLGDSGTTVVVQEIGDILGVKTTYAIATMRFGCPLSRDVVWDAQRLGATRP